MITTEDLGACDISESEQFQRDVKCYEQNCEQLRHLNLILWQVPIVAMTLTGGLWYAVASVKGVDGYAKGVVLLFAAIADYILAYMIIRVRNVFGEYLKKIEAFNPSSYAKATHEENWIPFLRDRGVVEGFRVLMLLASFISYTAAVMVFFKVLKFRP